jgi:hypothetical protein
VDRLGKGLPNLYLTTSLTKMSSQRKQRKRVRDLLCATAESLAIGELANGCKHFKLTTRSALASSASSARGFGLGRYGKGKYSEAEETISIQLDSGLTYDCLELAQGVLSTWETFFSTHGM